MNKHPLQRVIDDIQFENKSKYTIKLEFWDSRGERYLQRHRGDDIFFYLRIERKLVDSRSRNPITINNSLFVSSDITEKELVKKVFQNVGVFEAHEFMESFRYKDVIAFFPHDQMDHRGPVSHIFNGGQQLNEIIIKPWDFVVKNSSNWQICKHYAFLALEELDHKINDTVSTKFVNSIDAFFDVIEGVAFVISEIAKEFYENFTKKIIPESNQELTQPEPAITIMIKHAD